MIDELIEMITVKEKYGAEKALNIINERFDTLSTRERPYNIATFKLAIQIGFMFANRLTNQRMSKKII